MIVLLCGYSGTGKDSCAEYLNKHGFEHWKISKVLKDMLRVGFGFTDAQLESHEKDVVCPRLGVTPRQVMQFVGTELFQYELQNLIPYINRDFWLTRLAENIREHRTQECIVISDLRFVHELDFFKRTFPNERIVVVKLIRSSIVLQNNKTHPSEDEHNKLTYNYIVTNNGSLTDLYVKLDRLMGVMLNGSPDQDVMRLIDDDDV